MAGYSPDTAGSTSKSELTGNGKTVSKKSAGTIIGKSLESTNKDVAANQLTEMPILKTLIPDSKERPDTSLFDKPAEKPKRTEAIAEDHEDSSDPAIENLTKDELPEVVVDYAKRRNAELSAKPPAEEGSVEAAEDEASHQLFKELTEDPNSKPELVAPLPSDPEADKDEDDEAADAESSESADTEQGESEAPETPEAGEAAEEETAPLGPEELPHDTPIEFSGEQPDDEEDEDPQSTTSQSKPQTSSSTSPPPPNGPNSSTSPNGPNIPPPSQNGPANPNTQPIPNPNGPGNPNMNPFTAGGTMNPNAVPTTDPNAGPTYIENNYYDNIGGALFAGAILGYMLGRRRGRIKTERKLKAVSKKLERQIKQTRERVDQQEQLVRQQARERYNETHGPQPRGAEVTAARTEQAKRGPVEVAGGLQPEDVRTMKQPELLKLAEKIDVDGTNLRTIYEAKQITEPGLRRITGEFLRGGDVKTAVKQEQQVKEMQFERDPQMRDRLAASYAEIDAARPESAQLALEKLLAQDAAPSSHAQQATQQAAADAAKTAQKSHNQVLVSAWVALVVVLVIFVVVLALR